MTNSELPRFTKAYSTLLEDLAGLSNDPAVTNTTLGIGLPIELLHEPSTNTWIFLGCVSIEQDTESGETTLWHRYSDGPYGDPMNPDFFDRKTKIGPRPIKGNRSHHIEHGIDEFSWSLWNAITQAIDGSLSNEHEERLCMDIDIDFAQELRNYMLGELTKYSTLQCDCGAWAAREIENIERQ